MNVYNTPLGARVSECQTAHYHAPSFLPSFPPSTSPLLVRRRPRTNLHNFIVSTLNLEAHPFIPILLQVYSTCLILSDSSCRCRPSQPLSTVPCIPKFRFLKVQQASASSIKRQGTRATPLTFASIFDLICLRPQLHSRLSVLPPPRGTVWPLHRR